MYVAMVHVNPVHLMVPSEKHEDGFKIVFIFYFTSEIVCIVHEHAILNSV